MKHLHVLIGIFYTFCNCTVLTKTSFLKYIIRKAQNQMLTYQGYIIRKAQNQMLTYQGRGTIIFFSQKLSISFSCKDNFEFMLTYKMKYFMIKQSYGFSTLINFHIICSVSLDSNFVLINGIINGNKHQIMV